ncbi:hypothetical protein Srot_1997 [Segniliparus rotundus DSM 44985]|uniref:Uncharacterized protein n=1 Tax=Segniliparus rotundus (strain ATCC BAA-972 / CDC 1076 / CIP 108378 / DSM 44985 / JCM 13578) TaxID=640132 RepID=D6Z924_SEGRD|nr:hypothetical protein [Segniliparus rotundus]ADG98454.1 hypothetical protein Srot_1997 [Segniliparus rotundus DSM 44985]
MIQDGIPPLGEDLLYAVVFEDELFEDFGAWVLFLPADSLPGLTSSAAIRVAGRAKYAIKVDGFGLVPAVAALNQDRDFIQLTEWRKLEADGRAPAWAAVVTTRQGF